VDELPAIDDVTAADEPAVTNNVAAASESTVTDNVTVIEEPAVTNNIGATDNAAAAVAEIVTESQSEPHSASGTLTLVPANERLPSGQEQPAVSRTVTPRDGASGEVAPHGAAPRTAAPNVATNVAPPAQPVETPAAYAPPTEFSPFQAPLISSLEKGKWYVQLGVYSRPDNVEDEIIRIGSAYPVAIQNIGSDTSPMFRVLLGPLNQGESGAMLQRFKSIGYADAFVRHN
jgi:cell division septation protein DedD